MFKDVNTPLQLLTLIESGHSDHAPLGRFPRFWSFSSPVWGLWRPPPVIHTHTRTSKRLTVMLQHQHQHEDSNLTRCTRMCLTVCTDQSLLFFLINIYIFVACLTKSFAGIYSNRAAYLIDLYSVTKKQGILLLLFFLRIFIHQVRKTQADAEHYPWRTQRLL